MTGPRSRRRRWPFFFFFFCLSAQHPQSDRVYPRSTILQQGMHLNVFSKVYYDRVFFSCAERNMTGSGFDPPSGTPPPLSSWEVECPPPHPHPPRGSHLHLKANMCAKSQCKDIQTITKNIRKNLGLTFGRTDGRTDGRRTHERSPFHRERASSVTTLFFLCSLIQIIKITVNLRKYLSSVFWKWGLLNIIKFMTSLFGLRRTLTAWIADFLWVKL